MTQTGGELHAGIAIGWLDAEFALVIEHGKARRVADPAIGAAGVEAERGKAALKFLDLGEVGGGSLSGNCWTKGGRPTHRSPR